MLTEYTFSTKKPSLSSFTKKHKKEWTKVHSFFILYNVQKKHGGNPRQRKKKGNGNRAEIKFYHVAAE